MRFNIMGYADAMNDCSGGSSIAAACSDIFNTIRSGLAMADTAPEIFYVDDSPDDRFFAEYIFYVDDSPDDRFFAEYSASKSAFAFRLKTYATGVAAILDMDRRLARGEQLPALLIADHYMPIMDGPELLRHIREKEAMQSVRLVICSGGDDPVDVETALAAGAALVLVKPVDFEACRTLLDEGAPRAG
jgi:CheY-like chemotaxis protein